MADAKPMVLVAKNKEEGLQFNQTATGRILGVEAIPGSAFYRIRFVDGKPGSVPDKYTGRYTNTKYAFDDISVLVADTWDEAQKHISKAR